jgi:murein DD-endopeptidase MepM/ murein hydrolase activator NlpD
VGDPVLAAAAGRVSFVGQIAGRTVVAVTHEGGIRTTYEPLAAQVRAGQQVEAGEVLGTLQRGHRPDVPALHWGARFGSQYLDPLRLLLGRPGPPVLLPLG